MPDLQWNRKWGGMIASFSPDIMFHSNLVALVRE